MRRTDKGKVVYPKGISAEDRRFCRDIYNHMIEFYKIVVPQNLTRVGFQKSDTYLIACSGGLDSTVLAHAHAHTCTLLGWPLGKIVYVNHNLRPDKEIIAEIAQVMELAHDLGYDPQHPLIEIPDEGNVQALARERRYDVLASIARKSQDEHSTVPDNILTAHHANDVAETKLWQFLTGRPVVGITEVMVWGRDAAESVFVARPLLPFTREDLSRYASIWGLKWAEDSSNGSSKYARNRIRQELIPWIEKELNPGIVKMLAK